MSELILGEDERPVNGVATAAEARGSLAIVTGAGAGIGTAIAKALVGDGWNVAVCDIDPRACGEVAERLGPAAIPIVADVTDEGSVDSMLTQCRSTGLELAALVNNAGGFRDAPPVEECSVRDWNYVLTLNLTSAFLCTRAAVSDLRRSAGAIVNIASVAGRVGLPDISFAYAAAKSGLIGMTRALAEQLGPQGVRINSVAPGLVETERIRTLHAERLEQYEGSIPLRRMADASEIASVVKFLVSSDASYMHGATVDVNGGRLAL